MPATPRPSPSTPAGAGTVVDSFARRLGEFDGTLHEVASLAQARARARELIGPSTVARWADAELDEIVQADAPAAEAEVSLIRADVGVAETGTIGFVHGPGRSRGAALLPTRQVALLAREHLVPDLATALARFYGGGARPPASLVFAAGGSRTADIEQRMIRGMHGPRDLDVILFGPATATSA